MPSIGQLSIDDDVYAVLTQAALGTGIDVETLCASFAKIVETFAPRNAALLAKRNAFQAQIDAYLKERPFNAADYETFLRDIGYIVAEGDRFSVDTTQVDPEFTTPGPQLVCPAFIGENAKENARYPLHAVNARWESLYDSLYGTPRDVNVIDEENGKGFSADTSKRSKAVIAYANDFLDKAIPLKNATHSEVTEYKVQGGTLVVTLEGGGETELASPDAFVGYRADCILLRNHGLHIELQIDRGSARSKQSKAGVKDIVMESAPTTIIDLEDSVAAVDGHDKALAYRNVLGLLRGDLKAENVKNEPNGIRRLHADRHYTRADGKGDVTLHGRSMMLFRRVGMAMYTDAVTLGGKAIPEGFLDTLVIALSSLHDLNKKPGELSNSRTKSVYIVMPKMHGPEEVAMTVNLFGQMEKALGLTANTLKIGIMDEEQRTSVNLKECIRAAKERIVFINTGFLDRTGDLIHTAMQAGPMLSKAGIQKSPWLGAYEKSNVQIGLETGLHLVGQIGKGMWAQDKNPKGCVETKMAHPQAGATTAWIPSPKFGPLHAMHYHLVDVKKVQKTLLATGNPPVPKSGILELPLLDTKMPPAEKEKLLVSYAQSILGYMVRWIDHGVGCSSVPDADNVSLMEDRATLRIGSQLLANWRYHAVMTDEELNAAFAKAAEIVDGQNMKDAEMQGRYTKLVGNYNGPAFQAAIRLIHTGTNTPSGYVETVLHAARQQVKKTGAYVGGDVITIPK